MPTYTKSGTFGWAGGGKAGALVDMWLASRFFGPPAENDSPPPGSPDAGPVTTGPNFGSPGAFIVSNITTLADYYLRVQYGGQTFWGPCPEASLGGFTGGGGGGGGSTVTVVPIAFNSANLLTGATVYTPQLSTVIYDWWLEIDTAWNGDIPNFDLGTLTSGTQGLLAANGLPTIPLQTADANITGNVGLLAQQIPTGWRDSLTNAALTGGPPLKRAPLSVTVANPLKAIITQDGSTATATSATVVASAAATVPVTVTMGVNDTFIYVGSTPAGGGGSGTPETFTVTPGTYSTFGALVAAFAAATGSVSSEAFSTYATITQSVSNIITVTALPAGASGNGNSLQPGPTDFLAGVHIDSPGLFLGGAGGNPGATQGSASFYIMVLSP